MMDELEIKKHEQGVLIPVKAQAGARKNEFRGVQNGRLKVAVTQVAEKGKANKAIAKLLSKGLNVSPSQVTLLSGETHSNKQFLITGESVESLSERLEPYLRGPG